jgi:hypothetical protein
MTPEPGGKAVNLELSDSEQSELRTLLDQTLGDLSMEIADTDNPEFRRDLEGRRGSLQAIRSKLMG